MNSKHMLARDNQYCLNQLAKNRYTQRSMDTKSEFIISAIISEENARMSKREGRIVSTIYRLIKKVGSRNANML